MAQHQVTLLVSFKGPSPINITLNGLIHKHFIFNTLGDKLSIFKVTKFKGAEVFTNYTLCTSDFSTGSMC